MMGTSSSEDPLILLCRIGCWYFEQLTNEEQAMDQSEGEARFPSATSDKEDRNVTWADENLLALEERRVWIEAYGLPLRDLQVLKLE
jgi:hypothetical protein